MAHQWCLHPFTSNFTTVVIVLIGFLLAVYNISIFEINVALLLLLLIAFLFFEEPVYPFKWTFAFLYLYLEQRWYPRKMNNYDIALKTYKDLGFEATAEEMEAEKPKELNSEYEADGMFIYGTDSEGNALVLKLVRKYGRTAESWVHVKLKNGTTYQLPGHPDTTVYNTDGKTFQAAGLKLSVIEPMRKWRITFNGILREGTHYDWSDQEVDTISVKFNFIWTALFAPYDWKKDCSSALMADSITRINWSSHSWRRLCYIGRDGYDQWGILHGILQLAGKEETVLYLRGIRQHRWMKDHTKYDCSTVNVYGCSKDGTLFNVGASTFPDESQNLQHGHIVRPNMLLCTMTKCDLDVHKFTEGALKSGDFSVSFCGSGHCYNCVIQPEVDFIMYSDRPWRWRNKCMFIKYTLNDKEGIGIVEFTKRYNGKCPIPAEASLPLLSEPRISMSADIPLVLKFSQVQCCSSQIVGGKGASLALLSTVKSEKFTVPRGFCVTVDGLQKHLQCNPTLQMAITELENVAWRQKDGNLREICDRVSELFRSTTVSHDFQKAIQDVLLELFPLGCEIFAVRSSAVGEDSAQASAAGQNESLLGCKGLTGILHGVLKCWASLFTFQSVEYRRQHGLPVKSDMGLVIQEMIVADVAGVLFSCDPVTANPEHIVITANYGLGESVVSGMVDPDTVILYQKSTLCLEVLDRTLGKKEIKTVLELNSGTKQEKVNKEVASLMCISDEVAMQLGTIGIFLEKMFGCSQDIEWAILQGHIYLLQARPITTLNTWTDFELIHELDTALLIDNEHHTRGNLGEVLSGAQTPLTLSFIKAIDIATQIMLTEKLLFEFQFVAQKCRFFCLSQYHTMLNLFDLFYRFNEKEAESSLMQDVIDIAVFGHVVTTPTIYKMAVERNGVMSTLQRMYMTIDVFLQTVWKQGLNNHMVHKFEEFTVDVKGQKTAQSIYEKITECLPVHVDICMAHMKNTNYSVMSQVYLLGILTNGGKEWCDHTLVDLASLMSFCSKIESADIPTALEALAADIVENKQNVKFLNMMPEEAVKWLESHPGTLGRMYKEFIKKHGHRCKKETELQSLPWEMEPHKLTEIIQILLKNWNPHKNKKELTVNELAEQLLSPISPITKWIIKKILPFCFMKVQHREKSKTLMMHNLHMFRKAYRALGEQMVREGRIPDTDLVFFFTHTELGTMIHERSAILLMKAQRRRNLLVQLDTQEFPEIIVGIPQPEKLCIRDDISSDSNASAQLAGTPVCQGKVKGKAYVVLHLSEMNDIQRGDILITYSTDIGWSPYFPLLGGLVTELGGLISHGAVVAREYGLPCIVGVHNATAMFRTGDLVLLNSVQGTIQKLS